MRRAAPKVVVVTDRRRLAGGQTAGWQKPLTETVRGALAGGADLVQIREPDLEAGPLIAWLRRLFAELPASRAMVVVNDRADVALATGAAGVHLPERSLPPAEARRLAPGREWLIGRSVHSVEEAVRSVGASYLVAGTVLPTRSKVPGTPTITWAGVRAIVGAAAPIPVVAIGGLTDREAPLAAAAGASGIAAIGYFVPEGADDVAAFVQERVMRMRLAFDTRGSVPYTQGLDR